MLGTVTLPVTLISLGGWSRYQPTAAEVPGLIFGFFTDPVR